MNLSTISSELQQLTRLVNEWSNSHNVPDIEREIALDKLKAIYSELKMLKIEASTISENLSVQQLDVPLDNKELQGLFYDQPQKVETTKAPTSNQQAGLIIDGAKSDMAASILPGHQPEQDEKGMSIEEATPILSSISSLADLINSSAAPSDKSFGRAYDNGRGVLSEEEDLFEFEKTPEPIHSGITMPIQHANIHKEQPKVAVKPDVKEQPKPSFTPKSEAKQTPIASNLQVKKSESSTATDKRLGEIIGRNTSSLNESISPKGKSDLASKLQHKHIDDLNKAISFNDKFLFIRELFKGNGKAYEAAISTLNECHTIDEALIYIAENHSWDPSSPAANLLIELLQRRYE